MIAERDLTEPRRLIGSPLRELPTPALVLDLPTVRSNIEEMRRRISTVPAALRPHAKIHKSPLLAQMQLEAGAIGITTATVWEASAMLAAGIDDVLIANQVVGPHRVAELARLATLGRVIALVDDAGNAAEISAAALAAGATVGVLVELDVGFHRAGVRGLDAALELARTVDALPGLELLGPFGYEGHCMLEPDRAERVRKAEAANAELVALADAFAAAGLSTEIVAAGGLGTWDITGANPRITEIHAGSYVFSDAFHRSLMPGFEPALTVQATIVSSQGRMAVLDCGRKSVGIDRALPELVGVAATIRYEHGERSIHEEHIAIELEQPGLGVGDTVRVMPGYAPTTVNFYDCYFVAEGETVTDVWPVLARYGSETTGRAS